MTPEEKLVPLAVTVAEACRLIGVGPTTIYALIGKGKLKILQIEGVERRLIDFESLRALLGPGQLETLPPHRRRPRGRPRGSAPRSLRRERR